MKRALLVLLVACAHETTPPWQLDQDRILAVRATPPSLAPGETARLDALLAHADGPVTEEQPVGASAAFAPADLYTAVHYNIDHWEVNAPDEERLAEARTELGLPADAPVPLEITLELPGPLYATKTVYLGTSRVNPEPPVVHPDPTTIAIDRDLELVVTSVSNGAVRWFTSCGELVDHDQAIASLRVEEPCDGELVVVVRDDASGVTWRILPIRAQ